MMTLAGLALVAGPATGQNLEELLKGMEEHSTSDATLQDYLEQVALVQVVHEGREPGVELLENLRFDPREKKGDEAFGQERLALGDALQPGEPVAAERREVPDSVVPDGAVDEVAEAFDAAVIRFARHGRRAGDGGEPAG